MVAADPFLPGFVLNQPHERLSIKILNGAKGWGGASDSVSELGLYWVHASIVSFFSLGGNLEEFASKANRTGRMSASEAKKKRKDEWDRKI